MDAITIEGLTKYYGKARGVIDINLSVKEGDFYGFIGPNGAGKSTTIRTIMGLISPTRGTAKVFGKDIVDDKTEVLKNIGYLPSETTFYNGMKVGEILKLSADLRRKDCTEEAGVLCERLKLDISKKIDELSFGNKKKVGIVCAMQHKPKLYIMDEPTSGLDPLMQREFYSVLTERNEAGATIFLSSHILSEVQRYCKNAAIIRDGKILVSDSVEKLGHTGTKRVVLQGVSGVGLPNVRDVHGDGSSVSFLYDGSLEMLLREILKLNATDVTISEPDLEEIFMHFYEEEA